jgi:hypothetical protein
VPPAAAAAGNAPGRQLDLDGRGYVASGNGAIRGSQQRRSKTAPGTKYQTQDVPAGGRRETPARPHPNVRGLDAARLLRLSRLLGPRYRSATPRWSAYPRPHHRVARNTIAWGRSEVPVLHGKAPGDDRRSVLRLEPAAPPDPQDGMPCYPRGPDSNHQAVRVSSSITLADAAARLEVVMPARPGHPLEHRLNLWVRLSPFYGLEDDGQPSANAKRRPQRREISRRLPRQLPFGL